ncbi:hypothetical protein JCM3775_002993 [Rhodotorula graminis]
MPRLPAKPSWAYNLDELRYVAKTHGAPPNWDSSFTAPVLRTLFEGMNAADRREVLQRLGGSERKLRTPRSPHARPTSRAKERAASRKEWRRSLASRFDVLDPSGLVEAPRPPSPPPAPAHFYPHAAPHRPGSHFATSFEDVASAERERLQGRPEAGLHHLGELADALDVESQAACRPRARQGELRRAVLERQTGGGEWTAR